ncbi:MAG: NfeD family protein [Armatimonadota bacterium]
MEWSGIAIFYFVCLFSGFVFALIGAIFGELGGHFHVGVGGHHVEIGQTVSSSHGFESGDHGGEFSAESEHMPGASILNTITMATFVGCFGLSGLIAVWVMRMGPLTSLAFSLPTSVIVAVLQFVLYVKLFINAQASSEATLSDVLGCQAQVILGIPAGNVGQITYVIKNSRFTAPATSADGDSIPRGTSVLVVNIKGSTFMVRPM